MKLNKLLYILAPVLLLSACKKYDFDQQASGEGVGNFTVTSPATNSSVVLNSATPTAPLVIKWNPSKPGISIVVTYKWVAALKTGSFDKPVATFTSDNGGAAAQLTVTHKQLDSALKAGGIADGAKADLQWTVVASNTSGTQKNADNVYYVSVTRFGDGVTPFQIWGPFTFSTAVELDEDIPNDPLEKFRWQRALPTSAAKPVKYKVVAVEKKLDPQGNVIPPDFSKPLVQFVADNNGADTTLTLTHQRFDDSLAKAGMAKAETRTLLWSVIATSGNFSLESQFYNEYPVIRMGTPKKLYMVGDFNGWDINNVYEMIPDNTQGRKGIYYTYLNVNAGNKFLFIKTPGDWGSKYGDGGSGTMLYNGGGDFQPAAAGIYRVVADVKNLKHYIQLKPVGLVGDVQEPDWTPGTPLAMGLPQTNTFLLIIDSITNKQWKFHDGFDWDNSQLNGARYYGDVNGSGNTGDVAIPGENVKGPVTAGRYRVIFEVKNLKYSITPATEMRLVGDGINAVPAWNPGASPQMTYIGDGKWEITTDLVGGKEIKFLAGNDWGAFDYEDAGNGKIKYDGGGNFKTPATSGTYKITLDEQKGTITIQ